METVTATDPATRAALDVLGSGVGAASIMVVFENRINEMDHQIQTQTGDLESSIASSNKASEKLEALHAIDDAAQGQDGEDIFWNWKVTNLPEPGPNATEKEVNEYKAMLNNTIEFHGERLTVKELAERYDLPLQDAAENGTIEAAEVQKIVDSIKSDLQKKNSGNELKMVTLQTLMQQRSESIQMFTNILKTLHECDQAIIQNMR